MARAMTDLDETENVDRVFGRVLLNGIDIWRDLSRRKKNKEEDNGRHCAGRLPVAASERNEVRPRLYSDCTGSYYHFTVKTI